jgi:Phosphatidylglycerophosphate synthase
MLSVIPNLITALRFVLVIPISIYIYKENYFLALVLFIVAGISDGLDGYLARKFNWISEFGQIADPLADKCLILTTL